MAAFWAAFWQPSVNILSRDTGTRLTTTRFRLGWLLLLSLWLGRGQRPPSGPPCGGSCRAAELSISKQALRCRKSYQTVHEHIECLGASAMCNVQNQGASQLHIAHRLGRCPAKNAPAHRPRPMCNPKNAWTSPLAMCNVQNLGGSELHIAHRRCAMCKTWDAASCIAHR